MEDLKAVKKMTNVISESIYVELSDKVVELEPGKSLYDVKVKNLSNIRPYTQVVENLTEIVPN